MAFVPLCQTSGPRGWRRLVYFLVWSFMEIAGRFVFLPLFFFFALLGQWLLNGLGLGNFTP